MPDSSDALHRQPDATGSRLLRLCLLALVVLLVWNFWLGRELRQARDRAETEHHFWIAGHRNSPAPARTDAFLALVRAGNREWRGAHLQELHLPGLALTDAPLAEADLRNSDFHRSDLRGANLSGALLGKVDFTGADLSGADCSGANFLQARLPDADLRRTNLRGAVLEQVFAPKALLVTADLADAQLFMADFTDANLSGADLSGANLEAAIFRNAALDLARLSDANLKDADFTQANWWRARGLNTANIAHLRKRFAPGPGAPKELREDFQAWLKTFEASR
ncbi:MAG: pentapeptide repeat-containing protein [Limisphaerales bacterium]